MRKLLMTMVALVALALPTQAYERLHEISGPDPNNCGGGTYTLNGVTYKIYACCEVYQTWTGLPEEILVSKFVAFIKSIEGVPTEECVIPATFEDTGITFNTGGVVINNIINYRYVYTTNPNYSAPETGGIPAHIVSPIVEVWGFSREFGKNYSGYEFNSRIKTLRFEGDIRCEEHPIYVYDKEASLEWQKKDYLKNVEYFFKKSSTIEGTRKFTDDGILKLPNLETLSINTLTGYGVSNLGQFPKLKDVYFTSSTPYHASSPQFTGVSNVTAHLTNSAYSAYLPDDTYGYFASFKQVLPESVDVALSVENGAYVKLGEQLYPEGEYNVTVDTPEPLSFYMCDGNPSRAWVNGKEVSDDMENVDFLINDYETYKYTIPAKQLRPTVYVRCQASDKLNEIIHFDDAVVENLCVENWDTNGDGHLSKIEAANVTSLGKVFRENDEIISFNELQYFTGLTVLNDSAFKGCTELKYVILPKDMTTIGKNAFQNSGLLEIALPSKLTTLFSYAFAGCKNIEHIEIPSGVMSLPSYCFLECTGLKRLYIPKECYRFNQYPIGGCTGLLSIVVEDGNRLLSSPKSCNAIIYGDTLLLAGCRNTYIPDSVKIIYNYAFYDMKDLTSIEIPASVTDICRQAFCRCTNLTKVVSHIREPFTFGKNAFTDISSSCILYIPHGTRQAYIDKGWTTEVFKGGIVEMDGENSYDVNGDGQISITDVTKLVNKILGKE